MSKLLVVGEAVLAAGDIFDNVDLVIAPGQIFQKDTLSAAGPWSVVDGTLPEGLSPSECTWNGVQAVKKAPAPLSAAELEVLRVKRAGAVESAVVAVYQKPITLAREYELREADALAYKNAGYAGAPGRFLGGFAAAADMTPHAAADLVLSQATMFRSAEPILADLRMRKYEILRASTVAQVEQVYTEVMVALKQIVAEIA